MVLLENKINYLCISNAKTIIFDCDGVILNSNKVKKDAYHKVASSHYGARLANLLIEYLSKNTGNPREFFFNHFVNNIVPSNISGPGEDELVAEVALEVHHGLMECEVAQSIYKLRKKTPNAKWFVVSGGVQNELRDVFLKRSLIELFDGGIYGGPMTKDDILKFLFANDLIEFPALYIGDSQFDFEVSNRFNLDFLFVSVWTEFKDWQKYCYSKRISTVESLSDLA
jgi:phosphoglycolate phosphatase-like HAD superfamily hydrolase